MQGTNTPFNLGKLPADHLARLLARFSPQDPRVILGPRVGEDAAVLDMGDRYLIAKSDPITFATDSIGWYAVHINANDVACAGAAPRWFLATLLLPQAHTDAALVEDIFAQIVQACEEIGASLVGGHTEITFGLDRPILVGAMLGEVEPQRLVTTGGARPGDVLLLTQRVAVEATAIIAREKRDELRQRHGLSVEVVDRCADFIYSPGISVVRAAQVATATAAIHAMHDPTEGGVATGLWELASAADVGLEIDAQAVPIFPETQLLCDRYGLDPWGVIASGSLLLAVDAADADRVCAALAGAGVEATPIGSVTDRERGVVLHQRPERRGAPPRTAALPTFARDEIARLFE
jgi:hydrogenase expression/formation protein HypE